MGLLAVALGGACHLAPLTRDPGPGDPDAGEPPVRVCGVILDGGAAPAAGDGAAACTPDENPYQPVGRACASTVRDGQTCAPGSLPCDKTCGPAKSGTEVCTCEMGTDGVTLWSCPACTYDPARSYACYRVPDTLPTCPPDSTDPTGGMLVRSGDRCTQDWPGCQLCGARNMNGYRDSHDVPRVGFCVCTQSCTWSCASVHEWPHPCLTGS